MAKKTFGNRRGRPSVARSKGLTVGMTIKVTPAQRVQWQEAADRLGLTLGEWLRGAAELALARGSTR